MKFQHLQPKISEINSNQFNPYLYFQSNDFKKNTK